MHHLYGTTNLLESDDLLKYKIVYIAGHLARKYKGKFSEELYQDEDQISCEFLKNLDRGGLSVPIFSMVHFVYVGYLIYNKTNARCYKYTSFENYHFRNTTVQCRWLHYILVTYIVKIQI